MDPVRRRGRECQRQVSVPAARRVVVNTDAVEPRIFAFCEERREVGQGPACAHRFAVRQIRLAEATNPAADLGRRNVDGFKIIPPAPAAPTAPGWPRGIP